MATKSLSELRKSRGNFDDLLQEVEKMTKPNSFQKDDDRFWQPTADKAKNGYAVIRFLDTPKGDEMPWARVWDHGFQGPSGRWYIEKSLTTLGLPDPVSEYNSELWNSGDEDGARKQKRRLYYYSNIMVISDPANPQNDGKVFLFKYGKKIFDKIKDAMKPQFEDEEKINPFDLWNGANFKLKFRQVDGYRNYDKSEFEKPTPVAATDEEIEAIWLQEYSLKEFTDPSTFKSYDVLKAQLEKVLRAGGAPAKSAADLSEKDTEPEAEAPKPRAAKAKAAPKAEAPKAPEDAGESGGDTMSYFSKLAEEDEDEE